MMPVPKSSLTLSILVSRSYLWSPIFFGFLVSKDFPDISIGIKQYVEKYLCEPTYENGCKLVERYNQTVKTYIKLNRGTEEYCAKCRRACDKNLADHILRQVRIPIGGTNTMSDSLENTMNKGSSQSLPLFLSGYRRFIECRSRIRVA